MEHYQFQVECAHAEIPPCQPFQKRYSLPKFRVSPIVERWRVAYRPQGSRRTQNVQLKVDTSNIHPEFLLSSINAIDNF